MVLAESLISNTADLQCPRTGIKPRVSSIEETRVLFPCPARWFYDGFNLLLLRQRPDPDHWVEPELALKEPWSYTWVFSPEHGWPFARLCSPMTQ